MNQETARTRLVFLEIQHSDKLVQYMELMVGVCYEGLSERERRTFSKAVTRQARAMKAEEQTEQLVALDDHEFYEQLCKSRERMLKATNREIAVLQRLLTRTQRREQKKS